MKCEPYIPDYQDRYNDIEVTVTRVIPRDGYTVRELFLRVSISDLSIKRNHINIYCKYRNLELKTQLFNL